MKLSLIIPVYGNEEYMKKLLPQIEKQLTDEVEVIICDGTLEDTSYIDNFRVIHIKEEDKGVADARNKGLEIAKGKYIGFIDSDDMIADNYIKSILEAIETDKDYYWIGWKTNEFNGEPNLPYPDKEPIKANWAVWGYVIKKELIANERFTNEIRYEDLDFLNRVLKGEYEVINKLLYIYNFENENSLSHRANRGEIVWKKEK